MYNSNSYGSHQLINFGCPRNILIDIYALLFTILWRDVAPFTRGAIKCSRAQWFHLNSGFGSPRWDVPYFLHLPTIPPEFPPSGRSTAFVRDDVRRWRRTYERLRVGSVYATCIRQAQRDGIASGIGRQSRKTRAKSDCIALHFHNSILLTRSDDSTTPRIRVGCFQRFPDLKFFIVAQLRSSFVWCTFVMIHLF